MPTKAKQAKGKSDRPVVAPSDEMDDEMFIKHLNARHMPMSGLTSLRSGSSAALASFRSWHKRVHLNPDDPSLRSPLNHDHRNGW